MFFSMYSNHAEQLNQLLGTALEALDISDQEHGVAVARYEAVGNFLADYWGDCRAGGEVYPQGSIRLGTVTRKIHRSDEFDVDLVARRDIAKTSISQLELKADTGHGLDLFVRAGPEGNPSKEEGKRCWTLQYSGFHVDVLPALPDEQSGRSGILITDTEVRNWQFSDPIGYADWFHAVVRSELQRRAAFLGKAVDVADVPLWAVKTTLQRTVQALKRHRDIFFAGDLDNRPASIIITTLAARAYRGGESPYEVLADVTAAMPTLVEQKDGVYVVSNPVQPKENFADRWQRHPHRAGRFFDWMEQAQADFAAIGSVLGIDTVLAKLSKAFGDRAADRAERAAGSGLFESRNTGRLGMASGTGALVTGNGRPVQPHRFHGDRLHQS